MIEIDFDLQAGNSPALTDEWEYITDEFLDESEEVLARAGARLVRDYAESHIRESRHKYTSKLRAEVWGSRWAVTDQRSDYGPWLAGSSRRNRRSDFDGYPHWDEARAELNREKVDIVAPKLRGYRTRLRGGR
jgi:hypothetical protein